MILSNLTDLLRGALFVLAHWFGGSFGAAIVVASIALRVALLPISLPATRRRLVRERAMRVLTPKLTALKKRHDGNPEALFAATQRLYAEHGMSMFEPRAFVDALIQFPPGALLYSTVRQLGRGIGGFLWVPSLVSPDKGLAALAGLAAAGVAWFSASSPDRTTATQLTPVVITAVVSFVILSHISGGVALFSITNSIVGGVEQALARRGSRA